jgi:carboxymethylenebutenolidase
MGEMVGFKANGHDAQGYLALPASGTGPGVVVVQEYWGLVPHIKDICERLAREGFVALAPDLFHGETTTSPDEAGKKMMALRADEAEKDLRGAIHYLAGHDAVTSEKVGIVGFCMGGALALFAASKNPEIGACVAFYGVHPNIKPDIPNLQAPVLGIYAEKDDFVTPEVVRQLDDELTRHGKPHEFHTYPGVGHAFVNDTGKNYDEKSARDAWRRMVDFFRLYL